LVFPTEEGQRQARQSLSELGLDALVVIGGNGSLTGAHCLADCGVNILGLPASIDNDVGHTRLSIGVDTAVNTIVQACDRISDTASAHRRAFVVEVMGRQCGYLAMRAGVAADAILFSELRREEDETIARLQEMLRRSFAPERAKRRVLILKAEGVDIPTERIVARLNEVLPDVGVRLTVLGHVVRGGAPSAMDRMIAQRLAVGAVLAAEAGASDVMLGWEGAGEPTRDPSVRIIGLADVLEATRDLLNVESPQTRRRVALLREAEYLLAL